MQSTLAILAPAPGMLFLNGRFLGEAASETPLLAPIHPFGAVYIEYRPLTGSYMPLTGKLVFSGGKPLPDSLTASGEMFSVHWPGGVTELELSPAEIPAEAEAECTLEGRSARIRSGQIEVDGHVFRFPPDGQPPVCSRSGGSILLTGQTGRGQYLITFSGDLSAQTGYLLADRIEPEGSDLFRATSLLHDTTGHAVLERWQVSPDGLQLRSTAPAWEQGAPKLPATPEKIALAAIEAALLGLIDEAISFMAPALRDSDPLSFLSETYKACLPMKYALGDNRPCIALFRPESPCAASVCPLYYTAERYDGRWLLTHLSR